MITIHFNTLAMILAGSGIVGVIVALILLAMAWGADWLLPIGFTLLWLSGIDASLGVFGQIFSWITG
jgi:hypothetical protein